MKTKTIDQKGYHMLKTERKYEFRKRMLCVNKPHMAEKGAAPTGDEFALASGARLYIPKDEVIYTAAKDFLDFMYISMETPVGLTDCAEKADIVISVDPTYASYKCCRIDVTPEGVRILSHDARGAAQALFRLEDRMLTRRAPFLSLGTEERAPLYSPRMIHSGYGLDEFPDEHLMQIAKSGMDAILVFTKGGNQTPSGYLDFNELIFRASLHGLDVYAYSYMRVFVHPDDPTAEGQLDAAYGELFRSCPGIKGVVLVGESVGIPTKDPNAAPCAYYNNTVDGLPTGKPPADMWPCMDYAQWVELLQRVILPIKPDADIVFWSYNWGGTPEEHRLRLLRALPTGISLLVTFEMFQKYNIGDAVGHIADYSLSFVGPGDYFISEAEVAKERGIRLYSMTNTGGLTWDMGLIPYEPMPYQWIKRYRQMRMARDKWDLAGIMESHHFGFWPSFVSETAREAFTLGGEDPETALRNALNRRYGEKNAAAVDEALVCWSEAITFYIPSNEDQYGAFRIGPAYPFNLGRTSIQPAYYPEGADFTFPRYPIDNVGRSSLSALRIRGEIESLEKMLALLIRGRDILAAIEDPNEELEYLKNLGEYMICYVTTGIHAKHWYILSSRLKLEEDAKTLEGLIDEAEALLHAEYANVEAAIPCVRADSRLGWEPRQEYRCEEAQLNWKLRQLNYVLQTELGAYRRATNMKVDDVSIVADNFAM